MKSNSIIEIADFAESLDRVNSEAETAKGTEEKIGQFTLWWALRGGARMHTILQRRRSKCQCRWSFHVEEC